MTPAAPVAEGFVSLDYGGRCLDGVLPAAAGALGLQLPGAGAAQARFGIPSAERVCVVLVDGMGYQMLVERAGHAPFLRERLAAGQVLTVGYPSTTAASLGLFGTGCAAGRTGLAGYTVRNPATGRLANLVSWEGAGPPRQWQREPPLLGLIADQGVAVTSVGPARFAGSGLTEATLSGGEYLSAERLADRVDATLGRLAGPGLVYLYWGQADKVGHHLGWQSPQWADALTEIDQELGRLARSLPPGCLMLITADHGMVDIDPGQLVDVAAVPALAADVELVAGEPRATHVYTGAPQEVAARWREVLGSAAMVSLGSEAIDAGWFGPVSSAVRPLIGDVVVTARGRAGVVDSRTQTPHSLELIGMHGSLTPGEMLVPLLVLG